MSLLNSLFSKLGGGSNENKGSNENTAKTRNADDELKQFIGKAPKANYTFDSERDAPRSELCREGGEKGRECIMIQMQSRKLFEAMQNNGFFCVLPLDPTKTHIECTPLPQS